MDHAASEPYRNTAPELHGLLEELKRQEPIFHYPEMCPTREDFNRLTAPGLWETGASGRRYSRDDVWSILEQRYATDPSGQLDNWQTSEFMLREIAPATYLLTYTLRQDTRLTRRVTIWQQDAGGWKILYHQGTPVADQEP